ncbi:MAG: YncE family protein [Bacteroidota bacterium]
MKIRSIYLLSIVSILIMIIYQECTYDKGLLLGQSGYPTAIENIILRKCSVAGCHTTQSKNAAAGLDLSTWDHLFEGSKNGSAVIPFRADQSFLMYFINTFPDLGIQLKPVMPNNSNPLNHQEVSTLMNWIKAGAPNKDGYIKWSDNPNRKKLYVVNQGCMSCTVFDLESRLPMRYINVGDSINLNVHEIKMSPDNNYWYVIFAGGNVIEKHDASNEQLLGKIPIMADGVSRAWNSSVITPDGKHDFIIDWENQGTVAYSDLENMNTPMVYQGSSLFNNPHGCTLNNTADTLYVSGLSGNFCYKMNVSDPINNPQLPQQISLNGLPPNPTASLNSYDVKFSPDGTKYFVSCQRSGEVRIMRTSDDHLLATIPVGAWASELDVSESKPYLFVTCQEDTISFLPQKHRGSVYVINYNSNSVVAKIYSGWQPHGIAVDDQHQCVYIANRNVSNDGPAPHHTSGCGRNGYITLIDMNTLQLVPGFKVEVSSDPFDMTIRE